MHSEHNLPPHHTTSSKEGLTPTDAVAWSILKAVFARSFTVETRYKLCCVANELQHTALRTQRWRESLKDIKLRIQANPKIQQAPVQYIHQVSQLVEQCNQAMSNLVNEGKVSEDLMHLFWANLINSERISDLYYQTSIGRTNLEFEGNTRGNETLYKAMAKAFRAEYPENLRGNASANFFMFRPTEYAPIHSRLYVCLHPSYHPHLAIDAWYQALESSDMKGQIEFKISRSVLMQDDNIVIYITTKHDPTKIKQLMKSFCATMEEVSPQTLMSGGMPTARELRPGIYFGSELYHFNRLIEASGLDAKLSYSRFICYAIGIVNARQLGSLSYTSPEDLEKLPHEAIQRIVAKLISSSYSEFCQICMIVGIDPQTMTSTTQSKELVTALIA